MKTYNTILTRYSLNTASVLQETETKKVSLVVTDDGERLVLKYCKSTCPLLELEAKFMLLSSNRNYQHLELPKVIANGRNYILMSYVDREHQTRSTVLTRQWPERDIEALCAGIREFQSIDVPTHIFTAKQMLMGLVYPVFRLAMVMPSCFRRDVASWNSLPAMFAMGVGYLRYRPSFRNVTAHYDLTTLNCALTPTGQLSILDFELGYCRADPLFDVCYFLTIPPQCIEDWRFQTRVLIKFLYSSRGSGQKQRIRLILLVCCLVRAVHFPDGSSEQNTYRQSITLLLNKHRYANWWRSLSDHKVKVR